MPSNNKNIKHVCFDLDGTLINSYNTIYKSTVKTLNELKINEPLIEEEFHKRIGHHFVDIFNEMKIPVTDFEIFINIYKNCYFDFIDESEVYPGVEETLNILREKNISISLLTTKGQEQADKIIDHFGFRKYFDFVMGRRPGIANKPAAEPLLFICKELGISPSQTLMTGDTELDVNCGKNAEAKTCAVTYGYRSKDLLKTENPDFILDEISGLKEIIY